MSNQGHLVFIGLCVILNVFRARGLLFRGQNCALFALYSIFSKYWSVTFLYFGMNLPRDGANQLHKAGFFLFALKIIFARSEMYKFATFVQF